MKTNPYIGITGFTNLGEVGKMLKVFKDHKPPGSNRVLHVGVMMSYKTLRGIPTKWSGVFPKNTEVGPIFWSDDADIMNCLHYADYNYDTNTRDLAEAIGYAGPWVDAVQLDMPWPDSGMVAQAVHMSRKQIQVILQIGKPAFDMIKYDWKIISKILEDYRGVVHRVLLDQSMGRGVVIDPTKLLPVARTIRENHPNIGITVAGGLDPSNLELILPFWEEFPDVSIDAQARLCHGDNCLNPVDWEKAGQYLINVFQLLS